IAATGDAYTVNTWLVKSLMLSNTFQPVGQPVAPAAVTRFGPIEAFLGMPLISRSPFGVRLASRFEIVKNTWRVTPVTAAGNIKAQDVAGLPGGEYAWPALDGERLGAFLTEHQWQADWPSIV